MSKGHVVRRKSGGASGIVQWLGKDAGLHVALVRWHDTGRLSIAAQASLEIVTERLSIYERIEYGPR